MSINTYSKPTGIFTDLNNPNLLIQRRQNRDGGSLDILPTSTQVDVQIYATNPITRPYLRSSKHWAQFWERVECDCPIAQYASLVHFR